jgi:hypothetical protein
MQVQASAQLQLSDGRDAAQYIEVGNAYIFIKQVNPRDDIAHRATDAKESPPTHRHTATTTCLLRL